MQAITAPSEKITSPEKTAEAPTVLDWAQLYRRKPTGNRTLFELEAMVAKRMEFLAWMKEVEASPNTNMETVIDLIGGRLPHERRSRNSERRKTVVFGSEDEFTSVTRRSESRSSTTLKNGNQIIFQADEDLTSHLLCRYAFCMSEKWRKWFVGVEELLLRARIKLELAKNSSRFLIDLMRINGIDCEGIDETTMDSRIQEYIAYRVASNYGKQNGAERLENYYLVPLSLATRLIRRREVLCWKGKAILFRDQVEEVFLTVFRNVLNRGLRDAYLARLKQQNFEDENEQTMVTHMLDVFLEHFIADPTDNLQEGTEGSVKAGDVHWLAQTHFPPCMRMIENHLKKEGHLKHHGRFTYGLFLKAIGLSLDDSLALFSSLMTVKGGGSVEAFSKTAYGYNVRHNYGMEGKKTSYSSATCGTIINLPPAVDKYDCHGCPFRFREEGALRAMLQKEQKNPLGKEFPDIRPSTADIEDIVQDSKTQHYTRACYKYFMATHPTAKRDTLFRSPYEYYHVSRSVTEEATSAGGKRPSSSMTPTLREGDIKPRLSS